MLRLSNIDVVIIMIFITNLIHWPINAMSRSENGLSMDKRTAALINIQFLAVFADGLFLQDSYHPRKLAELGFVISMTGDPKTDSFGMSLSTSNSIIWWRCGWCLSIRRFATNIQVILTWSKNSKYSTK